MSIHEHAPHQFTVQTFKADPLGGKALRLCKRVRGRDAAEKKEKAFEAEAERWIGERRLLAEAKQRGIELRHESIQASSIAFVDFCESTYLPWARQHQAATTLAARAGTILILIEDLGNVALDDVENRVDALVEKWKAEGCRFTVEKDRLGRTLNRKARPISDAGINERLKILKAILGHACKRARVLPLPSRISMIKVHRAAPGAGTPTRFFSVEERVRFLRYASPEMADWFQVAVLSGMRPAELAHLLVGSVDLKQRKLWVQASVCPQCPGGRWVGKTGVFRGIGIADDLMPILRRLIKGKADTDQVIENVHGRPYARLPGGGGLFVRTLRKAGLARAGLSAYSTRHSAASDAVTAGYSLQQVAAFLGHTPRTCELFYAHLQPDRGEQVVKALKAVRPWGQEAAAVGSPIAALAAVTSRAKKQAA